VVCGGATIGAGAEVRNSIVGYRATIAGTAVVDGATVRGATLDGVVVGDEAYVGPGNELLKGLRVWPRTRLEATAVRFSTDA
jgi:mannose-1-phosphate guanylyltransferase